jgi:hypothetical protein
MKTSGPVIVAALVAATVTAASYGGISGGGASTNGISGGGVSTNGISGGGVSANGISGGGVSTNGISGGGAQLLVVGPVEAINAADKTAIVLGQRVHTAALERLVVGDTAAVYGTTRADGSIAASVIQSRGLYVPGATSIFLSGTVQRAESSVGRVVVGGVTIDLTPVMSHGMLSPTVGTNLQLRGIQPVSGGLVVVNGISGGGVSTNGISGGGVSTNGISGGGVSANGISGGGVSTNGISGGGVSANGISGGGVAK